MKKVSVLILFLWIVISLVPLAHGETGGTQEQTPTVKSETPPDLSQDEVDLSDEFAEEEEGELVIHDPLEDLNRGIFWFNDKFYFFLLKPVARVYRIIPEVIRSSVANFFSNVATPIRVVNTFFQGKGKDMGNEILRLIINSTIGLGGLFDPARTLFGISKKKEDFGQTLGVWGMGSGWYTVFPILGPANGRDTLGLVVDIFSDPFTYFLDTWEYLYVKAGMTVNATSLDKDTYEGIKKQALDPYLFIRNAYEQHRNGMIKE